MDLNELQEDVGSWATRNFGDQPASHALVGASEEIGELAEAYLRLYSQDPHSPGVDDQIRLALEIQIQAGMIAHSILKRTQGIRGDEPGVGPAAEAQAIERMQMNLDRLDQIREGRYRGREIALDAVPEPDEELVDAVADTVIYLSDFSHRAGVDLDHSVEATWRDVVSDRDWDSDLGDHDG